MTSIKSQEKIGENMSSPLRERIEEILLQDWTTLESRTDSLLTLITDSRKELARELLGAVKKEPYPSCGGCAGCTGEVDSARADGWNDARQALLDKLKNLGIEVE